MKTIYLTILALIVPMMLRAATPAARVQHYDQHSGLSHRSVKQIAQDSDGYMWFATWNGLNRFDGYEFTKIKPGPGDEARRYSDRIGDIKTMTDGNLLCRVDGRMLVFDTRAYKFTDLTSDIEKRLGELPEITSVRQTRGGETVLEGKDSRFVLFADSAPVSTASILPSLPLLDYKTGDNHLDNEGAIYAGGDIVYSGKDEKGNVWLITRGGDILCAQGGGTELMAVEKIDTHGEKLFFCTTDSRGNVWLRNSLGAYCVSMYELPYDEVADGSSSRVRAMMRDAAGRIWIGDAGETTLAVYDRDDLTDKLYIGADGSVSDVKVSFGSAPYTIASDKSGNIWVGTKPGGLHRLHPDGNGGYSVDHFTLASGDLPCDDIYDIKCDATGRLWVATLGGGVVVISNPESPHPDMMSLIGMPGYPPTANAVRKLLMPDADHVFAATRAGLLAVNNVRGKMSFRLHASEPDRELSLSNIATMDILKDRKGRIFVATESGGVDMLLSDAGMWNKDIEFRHYSEQAGIPSDISVSLMPDVSTDVIWVISDNMIYSFDPVSGKSQNYPSAFKGRKLRFSEGSPLHIAGNRWLVGHDKGCLLIDFDSLGGSENNVPVVFTSYSVQNGAPRLLSPSEHEISLGADERNLILRFAALDYIDEADIRYEFRIDGSDWVSLGHERSVSLLDLSPGDFVLEVRSTDNTGRWLDNAAVLNVRVAAKFHETLLFRILIGLLIISAIAGVIWVIMYIRRVNARQRETLSAYLKLLETTASADNMSAESRTEPEAAVSEGLTGEDAEFMDKVMEFVNLRLSDSEVGVNDMAEYVAVSRSGLTRKLKSILGVTTSEFLKESRLSRAASLITTTSMPVKDIAVDCGFADLNYFGKCFKQAYGLSPTHYRKEYGQTES